MMPLFPFLFGGAFIEAVNLVQLEALVAVDFPSFSEGLSLRPRIFSPGQFFTPNFPSFSEGLSLRRRCAHGHQRPHR